MKPLCILGLVLCIAGALAGQPASERNGRYDTPDFYLQQADWVVVGTLRIPFAGGLSEGPIPSPGHPALSSMTLGGEVEVEEVIKGSPPPPHQFPIVFSFFEVDRSESITISPNVINQPIFKTRGKSPKEDSAPFGYQQGGRYIFFLKPMPKGEKEVLDGKRPLARAVDPWFGVLPYNEPLVLGLREALAASRNR